MEILLYSGIGLGIMTFHTIEFEINRLDWLRVIEEERYHGVKDRDVHKEADERGSKILSEILELFPNFEKLKSVPQMRVQDPLTGNFRFYVSFDFYRAEDSILYVTRFCTAPNPHMRNRTTDLNILLSNPSEPYLNSLSSKIVSILDAHRVDDTIEEQHRVKLSFL